MSSFNELWEAAQRGSLILVDGGMCRYRVRKDKIITIYEIIVLPGKQRKGIGTRILDQLIALNPVAIQAKCPDYLRAACRWYKARGFKRVAVEDGKRGEIYTFRLDVRG